MGLLEMMATHLHKCCSKDSFSGRQREEGWRENDKFFCLVSFQIKKQTNLVATGSSCLSAGFSD